jgi:hypothetical protein
MNKKPKNSFDILVEDLRDRFSKIKNFDLINESEKTRKVWDSLVQTIVEFNSIKTLFINIYIPNTNKYIHEFKEEYRKSKYSNLLNIDPSLWQYETSMLVRIGYVTLFHKYENFVGNLFPLIDNNYIDFKDTSVNLKEYTFKKFDLKIDKEWYLNGFLKRINWISNSQKHNDGFPQTNHVYYKEDVTNKYLYPENERINITPDRLKLDIEVMGQFAISVFQSVMQVALFRMLEEFELDYDGDDETYKNEQKIQFDNLENVIRNYINLLREL